MFRIVALGMLATACWGCSVSGSLSKRAGAGPFFQIRRAGKIGYMDHAGRIVIPPRYDGARDFFHGLAVVYVNDKAGFIDEKGRLAIAARFDDARDFVGELAPVRIGRRWGYVDLHGNMVVEPQFQNAGEFREGLARIYVWDTITLRPGYSHGGSGKFTKDNAPDYAFDPLFEDPCQITMSEEGRFGFIDQSGRIVIPPRYAYAGEFADGLAQVKVGERFGFVDRAGNLAIPAQFEFAATFSEGLASIHVGQKRGFIDRSGRIVIPAKYGFVGDFHDGLARVKRDGRWGYLDRTGKLAIPFRFRSAWNFSDGLAVVGGSVYSYIDRTGKPAVRGIFGWDIGGFSDGLAPVPENALFTISGLMTRLWNRITKRPPGVVWIDKSGWIVARYDR